MGLAVRLLVAFGLFYILFFGNSSYYSVPEAEKSLLAIYKHARFCAAFLSSSLLFAAFFALLFAAARNGKRAKLLCRAASILILLRIIPVGFGWSLSDIFHPSICSVALHALLALGAFFAGEALADMAPEKEKHEHHLSAPVEKSASGDSLDALVTLKQLLDSGAITQEEFDAKKKQLLGL